MCGKHDIPIDLCDLGIGHERNLSRRGMLKFIAAASTAAAASVALTPISATAVGVKPNASSRLILPNGNTPARHALHVHGPYSEAGGSWMEHIKMALENRVDVLHPTDHDWRIDAAPGDTRITREFVFTSLDNGLGFKWVALPKSAGTPAITGTASARGLSIYASAGSTAVTQGVQSDTENSMIEGNVQGRSFVIPLTITKLSGKSYAEVVLQLSRHGAKTLTLVYRYGADANSRVLVSDTVGHIYRKVSPGQTLTTTIVPLDDLTALFPSIDNVLARDNSVIKVCLQVTAKNGEAGAFIPRIDMPRTVTGNDALNGYFQLINDLARQNPSLVFRKATEVSGRKHHFNWFGNDAGIITSVDNDMYRVVRLIQANGGVASKNHPYGTIENRPPTIMSVYNELYQSKIYGAKALELGYAGGRGGRTFRDHMILGDMLLCSNVIFTTTGVSDAHDSPQWAGTFLTQLWSNGTRAGELAALSSGQAAIVLNSYVSQLWMTLNGRPMGSIPQTPTGGSEQLDITITDLPRGAKITLITGTIQNTPLSSTVPPTTSTDITSAFNSSGMASVTVPGGYRYHRVEATDSTGAPIIFSNPVWSGAYGDTPAERLIA